MNVVTTKEIISDYNSLPADISSVEWVLKSDVDRMKKELRLDLIDALLMNPLGGVQSRLEVVFRKNFGEGFLWQK